MKKIVKTFLYILFIIINISIYAKKLDVSVRNSSDKEMQIKLERKSNQLVIYKNTIPATRTIKIENIKPGSYSLYYKYKNKKLWRVMKIILLKPGKTFILF